MMTKIFSIMAIVAILVLGSCGSGKSCCGKGACKADTSSTDGTCNKCGKTSCTRICK